jgi:PAS domain S-box-containing protein
MLRLAAALLAGLALLAMLGWAIGSAAIVQGGTRYVPMQFNTALGCLLASVSLGLLGAGWHRRVLLAMLPVVVLSLASLVEEYAGLPLGVGEWLLPHGIVAEGVAPGRMAPNTAMGFLLAALGIALAPRGERRAPSRWAATWACGFMVSVIGAVVLVGYLVDVPAVRAWGTHTPMALLTGAAMLLLGLGLAFAGTGGGVGQRQRGVWLPLVVAMAVTLTSIAVWFGISQDQAQREQAALVRQMDGVEQALAEGVNTRLAALERMARRMTRAPDDATRLAYFRLDAELFVQDFPSMAALAWTDRDGVALDVYTRLDNAPDLVGRHLDLDAGLAELFRRAEADGQGQASGESAPDRGELIVRRAERGGETVGFVVSAIEYERLFPRVLSAAGPQNDLALRRGEREVFRRGERAEPPAMVRDIELLGAPLRIELWPITAATGTGSLANLLLFTGLVTGGLLALALRLAALARQRAEQAEDTGRALAGQMAEHERARLALAHVERELGSVFSSISDAFYILDHDWRFVLVNPRAEQMMERAPGTLVGQVVWEAFPDALGTEIETQFRAAAAERRTKVFEVFFPPLGNWFAVRVFPHPNGIAVYFQDISDRKRAELALARAQASSSRAQRLAQLGAWEFDLTTGELQWSDDVLRLLGLAGQRTTRGLPALLERVVYEDRARVQEAHRALHAGEGDIDIEYRVRRPDGETRAVREIGTLVRDDQGQPLFAAGAIQDMTERRRAEDALRELTRRLEQSLVLNRLVMDNSLDVICAIDANGRFSQVSAASAAVWGHPPNELLGRPVADLVHPDDRGATHRAMADVLAGRPTLDFRNRLVTREGRIAIMQWSLVWSPRERLVFAVARDATESERQSQALREAKESLQRAQQVARMGAWEFDIARNALSWSDEVFSIFHVGKDEFGGNFEAFAARVHPDDVPALAKAQEATLAGGPDLDIEHRIVLPDGSVGHVHERARLIRDESGAPRLLAGSVQDISERKRQEQRLRESEQRMRTTVESAFDCIVTMGGDGRILEFNAAAERTFGHDRADVIGKTLSEVIIPPALRAAHEAGMRRYLATGEVRVLGRRLELPALRADGGEILVELSITEVESEAGRAFTGFIRDITAAKLAQRLEAGQRAILAGIAARRPLQETLEAVARLYQLQYPEALCSILLLDEAGERVLTGAAPDLPEAFSLAVHGQPIGPRAGSCGTAAWRGERVVVTDIGTDPLWEDYRALALEHGLHACWSTPVKSGKGRVLATFATYYRQPRTPTATELAVVDSLAAMVAMAVEQVADYRRIQLSEQRFRSLFDEHPDAVYSMDLDGRYTDYNGRLRATGLSIEQVRGQMFDANVSPEQREIVRGHFSAAVRGEARTYEATAVLQGGQRLDMRVTNLPIVVDGRVTGVFGIAQDISLLRKHQRELAEALDSAENNSRQLRRLSDAAISLNRDIGEDALYPLLADLARDILGAHQAVASVGMGGKDHTIHAVSLSEKYAKWRDYATPADNSGIYSLVAETNQPMRLTQAELEAHPRWRGFGAHAKDHPPMRGWLAVPLVDSAGRNMGLLQLSDKQRGEFSEDDQLVAMQFAQMASIAIERARLIARLSVRDRFFDMSAEIFVIFSPATRRWLQVNPVFCQITGYTAEELCGREFTDFIHPDDRGATRDRAARQKAGVAVPHHFENRYVSRDGGVHWISWISVPGADGLVYGVGRDITERRRAEQALRQTLVDLNNRNRELQDFAFIASHDLQEPLRKIRAFSDRLQQRHAAQLAPEARDYLDRTGQAAARMQTLIDDLLAYSRVVARGKPFAKVDLETVLTGVIEDLEARIESSGGRIERGPLPTLEADPTQMRQLFQNLLSNALKFRAPERAPVVRVSASQATLDGAPAWELRVEDNGIGFDPKYAEKIFGPFQRLHGRQDYEGTGIGLAIVRRIAERHRGTVRAEGRPGDGAAFILLLPVDPASDAGESPVSGAGL